LNSVGISTTLTNANGLIFGAGEITVDGRLDNQAGGTILANGKNDLTINLDPDDRFNNDGHLEAEGSTLKVTTAAGISGGGEALVANGGTIDLSDARAFLGSLRYLGRGTILGPDRVPAGTISGFATGDTYVFGTPTKLSGPLSTLW